MALRDIIQQNLLVSCMRDTPVRQVAQQMKFHNVGCVLIVEKDKPVGIVTDRDIVVRCVAGELPLESKCEQIMSKTVHTVSVKEGIQDTIRHMKEYQVRRLPVVDESGKAVGIISFGDLFSLLAKELAELSSVTALPLEPVEVGADVEAA